MYKNAFNSLRQPFSSDYASRTIEKYFDCAESLYNAVRAILKLSRRKKSSDRSTARKLLQDLEETLRTPLPSEVWGLLNSMECGELKDEFDQQSSLYHIWVGMKCRCRPKNKYGRRGIKVCEEWKEFSVFKAWAIANGYELGLSIDRVDNDGNYEPSNCQWLTRAKNSSKGAKSWPKKPKEMIPVLNEIIGNIPLN